ncbi:MAG: S8 family serine peptidase [Pseudoxanthomonas sp.]
MTANTPRCFRATGQMHMNAPGQGIRSCALAAAIALSLSFTATAGELRFASEPVPGQYIVVLKDTASGLKYEKSARPATATVAAQMGRSHGVRVLRSYDSALRGFVVKASDNALAGLVADPRVAYVEEDGIVRIVGTQPGATWGLDRVDQRNLPLNGTYGYDATAATVHAYIIDTGIYAANNDFGGRVSGGFTAINDGNGTNDCNLHGTHVAGTVGGATWGVAKQVQLHPVRVLGCGGEGTYSEVIAGVDWVTANHASPAVANLSLGGGASQAMDDAITRLVASGVVTVVAAGNDSADACTKSPARAAAAITVGATTATDVRAGFSNFGRCVDMFAPGVAIKSAGNTTPDSTNVLDGTSMASPHVAGAAALFLSLEPDATPTRTTAAILNSSSRSKVANVAGSPNLLLFSKGFNTVNGPVFVDFTATSAGLIARFADTSRSNSGAIVSRSWDFGDGGKSSAAKPTHVYPRSGTYTVTETVTDVADYTESRTKTITIR